MLRRLVPILLAAPAFADHDLAALSRDLFDIQPDPAPHLVEATDPDPGPFGEQGQSWLTFSAGGGYDFDAVAFVNPISVAYSTFLDDNFEWILEGSLWYFDTTDQDSFGAAAITSFRWHAVNNDAWSLFGEIGIGICAQTEDVPPSGTEFNFAPRLGIGVTHRLGEGPIRAEFGVRWQHLSNGHIQGDDRNPAMDAAMVYIGIMWPLK